MDDIKICNLNSTIYLNPDNGKFIAVKEKNKKEKIEIIKKNNIPIIDNDKYSVKSRDCFIELIIVNITNNCNLKCSYCYRGQLKSNVINIDKLIEFLREFSSKKRITVLFQGGEPLLEFEKIKKIVQTFENKFEYAIQTNGVLLTEEIVRYCKDKNIRLSISIDGIDYDDNKMRFYNDLMSFQMLMHNISEYSQYLNMGAITVVNRNNVNKILKIAEFFIEHNILLFSFNLVWPIGRGEEYKKDILCASNDELVNHMIQVMDLLYKHNISKKVNLVYERNLYLLWRRIFYRKFDDFMCACNPCGAGNRTLTIDTDGKIYPCTYFIEPSYIMGNTLYDEKEYSKIELKFVTKEDVGIKKCTQCIYKWFCGGGCTGAVKMFGQNPYCEYYKKLIPKMIDWQITKMSEKVISNFKI